MALEKQFSIKEVHTRSLTAVGYNPARREIVVGCEDGVIKTFEAETGRITGTTHDHKGWVTDFLYWADQRLFLSSANDGLIIAWSSAGLKHDVISLRSPVYSMTINPRRQQLVCGMNAKICAYDFDAEKESGHIINPLRPAHTAKEHSDLVKIVLCYESRVYSAGYDAKLIIYDSSYTGEKSMTPVHIHRNAHDAGICTLVIAKDQDNTWVITGGFDKTVKIWSVDGKLIHRLEGFLNTISGVCYVPRNKTIWVASGNHSAQLFDPKSGDNISDYIGTFSSSDEDFKYSLQHLKWQPELNQVIGTTSRRHVLVWKYNPSGCITALRNKSPIESITYTNKRPILIFTGDHEGAIMKWEQMQSNNFMYSNEAFIVTELMLKKMSKLRRLSDKEKLDLKNTLNKMREKEKVGHKVKVKPPRHQESRKSGRYGIPKAHDFEPNRAADKIERDLKASEDYSHANKSILATCFVEELDVILAASEDSNVYVWGFDDTAVAVLHNMKKEQPMEQEQSRTSMDKYAILLQEQKTSKQSTTQAFKLMKEEESVSNRVAGFICKYILSEHSSCVTSMCVIHKSYGYDSTYMVSGGWDHRLCVWNLETGSLQTIFTDKSRVSQQCEDGDLQARVYEWAADGVITCMDFNPNREELAYGSSDNMIYIRRFSLDGTQMPLLNTLKHDSEVTALKWNFVTSQWVSGSDDGIIRVWAEDGMNDAVATLSEKSAVTCVCIDANNGSIIAAFQNVIKVFDSEKYRLMQTNVGHTDSVRDVIHIPERSQYVSCSWDKTIRIWNEWKQFKKKEVEKIESNPFLRKIREKSGASRTSSSEDENDS